MELTGQAKRSAETTALLQAGLAKTRKEADKLRKRILVDDGLTIEQYVKDHATPTETKAVSGSVRSKGTPVRAHRRVRASRAVPNEQRLADYRRIKEEVKLGNTSVPTIATKFKLFKPGTSKPAYSYIQPLLYLAQMPAYVEDEFVRLMTEGEDSTKLRVSDLPNLWTRWTNSQRLNDPQGWELIWERAIGRQSAERFDQPIREQEKLIEQEKKADMLSFNVTFRAIDTTMSESEVYRKLHKALEGNSGGLVIHSVVGAEGTFIPA